MELNIDRYALRPFHPQKAPLQPRHPEKTLELSTSTGGGEVNRRQALWTPLRHPAPKAAVLGPHTNPLHQGPFLRPCDDTRGNSAHRLTQFPHPVHGCVHAKSLQSCLTLFDPPGCSPPGSSVHGILQARILEWVAMPSSRDLPDIGMALASLMSPALAGGVFTSSAVWEAPSSSTAEDKYHPP